MQDLARVPYNGTSGPFYMMQLSSRSDSATISQPHWEPDFKWCIILPIHLRFHVRKAILQPIWLQWNFQNKYNAERCCDKLPANLADNSSQRSNYSIYPKEVLTLTSDKNINVTIQYVTHSLCRNTKTIHLSISARCHINYLDRRIRETQLLS